MVFDAAAKWQGICLNDKIHQGPKLQTDLFEILLRFRRFNIALTCDMEQMFLQIKIKETDRRHMRFLWRKNKEFRNKYEFNRLSKGMTKQRYIKF